MYCYGIGMKSEITYIYMYIWNIFVYKKVKFPKYVHVTYILQKVNNYRLFVCSIDSS